MSEIKDKLYLDAPKYLVPLEDPTLNEYIKYIREIICSEYNENNDLFLRNDINKLKSCDFEIRRYLFHTGMNKEESLEMIRDRLIWRKNYGFGRDKIPQRFPLEFYKIGGIFECKTDKDGDPVLYIRSRLNIKLDVLKKPIRQFLVYNIEQMDQKFSHERSWGLVFDAQGFSWSNIDFDLLFFIIKLFRCYYCWTVKYIAIYEIPWLLQSVWNMAQGFIPEDGKRVLRVYNKKTITEIIDKNNLPFFMGGDVKKGYIKIPEGAQPAEIVAPQEYGLSTEEVRKIIKHLDKIYKEFVIE